jgi:hypothetical protein
MAGAGPSGHVNQRAYPSNQRFPAPGNGKLQREVAVSFHPGVEHLVEVWVRARRVPRAAVRHPEGCLESRRAIPAQEPLRQVLRHRNVVPGGLPEHPWGQARAPIHRGIVHQEARHGRETVSSSIVGIMLGTDSCGCKKQ